MQTIKTAVVVVLLLAVCYGAIVALNAPDPKLPPELEQWAGTSADLDMSMDASELVTLDPHRSPNSSDLRSKGGAVPNNLVREPELLVADPSMPLPTLPKFDISGNATSGNSSAELASIPAVGTPGTQGPDGPIVPLPYLPGQGNSHSAGPGFLSEQKLPIPGMLTASTSSNSWSSPDAPEVPTFSSGSNSNELPNNLDLPSLASPSPNAPATTGVLTSTTSRNDGAKIPTQPFKLVREQVLKQAAEGKLKDALTVLSPYYHSVELPRDEYVDLVDLLDALSKEVIYSKQHLMEPAYRAVPGDTLQSIAIKHNVSTELLARINGLGESNVILPGTTLKVVRGPFRAEVNLTRGELTMFVGELYAGRFPISTGEDPIPREGNYEIVDKRRDRTYYGTGGNVISAEDPRNPYGGYWINLGQDMCIHGTPEMATSDLSKAGCISLSPIDASDIYGILAQGSRIRVHR